MVSLGSPNGFITLSGFDPGGAAEVIPSISLTCTNGQSVTPQSVGDISVGQFFLAFDTPANLTLAVGNSVTLTPPYGVPLEFNLTYWNNPFATLSGYVTITVTAGPQG